VEFEMQIRRKSMLVILMAGLVSLAGLLLYGPRLAGQWMAWQETRRLIQAGADPQHTNPPARRETFAGVLGPVWAFNIINGAGQIGHAPVFHNTSLAFDQGLTITQQLDPEFEHESATAGEPASQRYNNATLIGFQGYQPTPAEDVVFQARMQVSPEFYGSAGFMLQPQGTILPDGTFNGRFNNQAFTLFGICFLGPESNVFGRSGATVEKVLNWWPVEVQELAVDMHELHTYQLRLHWVDAQHWQGFTMVDERVVSTMMLPPLGPVEVHIWGDNYLMGTTLGAIPSVGFQNGPAKWIRFGEVAAWVEAARR
jgi:hypothetical protein